MVRQVVYLVLCPRLIRKHTAIHDTGFRFGAQEETALMRKNRIDGGSGLGLPGAFNVRLAVRGARRRIRLTLAKCGSGCQHQSKDTWSHLL
jgi:hypothetical protein